MPDTANSAGGILATLQNGVTALNNLAQAIRVVTTTSSGTLTLHLTNGSSS